ncbi:3-oxoacyl-[acyl-carrier-protein] reductase FabG (fragment) [Kyrpidia spormannii]|uniref:3-oxoacyl-[acyl-carrier-protein] reductase FabG n=1 Tax=Kyrpidia spormannii TaxID=2055160 RepID=A0A6F9EFZ1_9BACL
MGKLLTSLRWRGSGGLLGNSCYAASKGGVIAFTKSAAREGAPYGINVNAVAPALTDTDMTAGMDANQRDAILGMVPLGRAGRPEDVAKAVCFLASSESDYLTGEIMDVDGGLMMD